MTFFLFAVIALLVYALIAWLFSKFPSSGDGVDWEHENRSFNHRHNRR